MPRYLGAASLRYRASGRGAHEKTDRRAAEARLTREDIADILDFLDYDSKVRKIDRRVEFEELTDELKRRFEPIREEQRRKVLERTPRLMDPADR